MSLRVDDLTKRYGEVAVFAHVNLTVADGEFVAIVGESGVGKSSLLNCLAGLDDWQEGRVLHDGIDLGTLDESARAHWRRQALGFVFQAFHVLPHLDVAQNVALPLMLLGIEDGPSGRDACGGRPAWVGQPAASAALGRPTAAGGHCAGPGPPPPPAPGR